LVLTFTFLSQKHHARVATMTSLKKLASADQVNQSISQLAQDIISDYEQTPLFVALLRGAAPFASKLMHAIAELSPEFHPELDYMMVSTYGDGHHAGEPHIVTDLAPSTEVRHRPVIIIDDVLDKGITADFVTKHLIARGASEVKLAVLCQKNTQRISDITPDYCGFSFADKWLVGMGLDDSSAVKEGYRWLDEIRQV
jgi:hypoxanthine phosphoribosyltransferase